MSAALRLAVLGEGARGQQDFVKSLLAGLVAIMMLADRAAGNSTGGTQKRPSISKTHYATFTIKTGRTARGSDSGASDPSSVEDSFSRSACSSHSCAAQAAR
jgi:hypothetical protein